MQKNKKPFSWATLLQSKIEQIPKNLKELKKIVKKWHQIQEAGEIIPTQNHTIIIKYLRYWCQTVQIDRFKQFILQKQYDDRNFDQANSEKQIYINFKLLGNNTLWTLLLSQEVIDQFQQLDEDTLISILGRLSLYMQGYIPISEKKQNDTLTQIKKGHFKNRFYKESRSNQNNSLLFSIGVQKVPCYDFNNIHKISQFAYKNYIEIISVLQPQIDKKNIEKLITNCEELQKQNPTKNFENDQLIENKLKMKQKTIYFKHLKQQEINDQIYCTPPLIYQSQKLTHQKCQDYFFTLQDYYTEKEFIKSKQNQILTPQQQQLQREKRDQKQYMKRFKIQKPKTLVALVDGFQKYKLTLDEKEIIWAANNTITLGRSGTGKTVSAIVKLLSIEMYHKKKQHTLMKELNNTKQKFSAADIVKSIGLRNVFLTASEKLIFEIKNIYDDLVVDIQTEGRLRNNQNQENSNILENQTQSIFETIKDINVEDQNIDIFEAYNQKEMNKKKLKSFNKLKEKDYPGFFSISQFITLIDGTVSNPFFKVQKQDQNQEKQTAKIQQKIGCVDLDEQIFEIQDIQQYNEKMGKKEIKIDKIQNKKRTKMTYNIFYSLFWQTLDLNAYKTNKELSPAVAWSEIYSTIKGSVISHRSHSKYLSKAKYLKLSQDKFYDRQDKKVIYSIFEYYEDWKNQTGYFDQMDVVNRILSQIRRQGYRGPLLNFLFIDQVQDLTPATLYLLSGLFENGLFYFGDTAQSIAKGVSFKFGDIQKMFSKKFQIQHIPHLCPQRIPLTVNFRSHNQILQLANSVISSIEFLFQDSIDVMKKEKSNFHGPRPILINKVNEVMLLELLTDEIVDKNKIDEEQLIQFTKNVEDQRYFKLSAQQAIIIRNAEDQKKLPYRLQQATILTYQQAKGLQYDDIILYNYFSSSKDKDMWKLISYLDVVIVQRQKSEYQKQIQLRQNQIAQNQKKLQIDLEEQEDQNKKISMPNLNQNGYYEVKTIVVNEKKKIKDQDRNKYYDLLSQLKILYTIITRAKKTFVIYDTKLPPQLQNLWMKMGLIKCINNQKQLLQEKSRIARYKTKYKSKNYLQQEKSYKKQGIKWFFNKNYDKAIKAFKNINQTKAIQRIQAQKLKYQCQMEMKKLQNQLKNPKKLQKELFKIKKKTLQNRRQILTKNFVKAGEMFQKLNCFKSAGNCYYQGQNYKQSLFCFQKCKLTLGCAQACKKLQRFQQAAKYFEELKMIQKMFQCYEMTQNWKNTFEKLNQYKQNQQIKKKGQKFYKNYGNQYLCEIVSQFKQSVNGFNNIWKTQHQFQYTSPLQKSQSKDFLKRKISEQCKIYTDKLRSAYSMLQIYEKKDKNMQEEMIKIKKQLQRISLDVQTIQPYQKLQKVKLYDNVWSQYERTGKGKQLQQFIKRESIQHNRPINERYIEKVKNQLKKFKNEIIQNQKQLELLKDKINQNNEQINNIQIRYGPLKKIQEKFKHFYILWKENYFTNAKSNNIMNELNDLKYKKNQYESQQLHLQQFKRLNPQKKQYQQFQVQDFSQIFDDESFDSFSNYSQEQPQQNKASVIFNFSIQKNLLKFIVEQAKQIISQSSSFIHNNIKGPFSRAHHLSLNAKVQSYITIQLKRLDLQQAFSLCKKVQFIGEHEFCLLISSYYQCYQNCKKYIISYCTNYSQTYKKSARVLDARNKMYQQEKNKKKYSQIYLFLNRMNPQFLQKETFRTLYSKQKIINFVVQSLILLGHSHQVFRYLSKNQKVQLSCYFMNYQKMREPLRNQSNMRRNNNQNRQIQQPTYYFVNEKQQFAELINFSTFQQIFWYYDSFQNDSFLSYNDWIQSVVLNDRQCDILSQKVQNYMKLKEQQIQEIKKKIHDFQQQYHINVPTRHTQQRSKTIQNYKMIKQEIQHLKIDQKELQDLIKQLYHQKGNSISNINVNKKKIEQNLGKVDSKIRNIRQAAKIFKQLKSLCQIHVLQTQILFSEQDALRNYLKLKILKRQIKKDNKIQQNYSNLVNQLKYDIQQFQELQGHKRKKINLKLLQFYKQCLKTIQLIDSSELKTSFRAGFINKIKEEFRFIEQIQKLQRKNQKYDQQIKEKQYSIQCYKGDLEQIKNLMYKQKQNLKRQQNLWKYHEDQLKQIQNKIKYLEKVKKQLQKNLEKEQSQYRQTIFNQRRIVLASQNKQEYKDKIIQKIRNVSDGSSKSNEMAFLKQLINGFQQKFQQANTFRYKTMLFKIIQNGKKHLRHLDVFQISQVIMLYLCCINYQNFAKNIGEFLLRQEQNALQNAFEASLDLIDKKMRLKKQEIQKFKNKMEDIGYMNAIHKNQLNKLQNQFYQLQQDRKYTPRQKVKIDQSKRCHYQFIKTMNFIYQRISHPKSQDDIKFIYHLLGFFQCKVVQNSKLLWFLDRQYVLVKSTSIIVNQAIKIPNIFCYYMDDNKQIILMKLYDVYRILKTFIKKMQKNFITFAGYKFIDKKQLYVNKQIFSLLSKIKQTNLDNKQNKLALESQIFCNRQKESQIKELYRYYTQQSITKNVQSYKLTLFEFYFQNQFKSHQNFHFFIHQLKSICQIQDILLKSQVFCYSMMNQIKNLYDNLQNQFLQWKKYYEYSEKERGKKDKEKLYRK